MTRKIRICTEFKDCECGYCDVKIPIHNKYGFPLKYAKGHYFKMLNRTEESKQRTSKLFKGKKRPPELIEKLRQSNLGRKRTEESRRKQSQSRKGKYTGELCHIWKGDNVGYFALHNWMRKHLPKKELCEVCQKVPPKVVACITGTYNREFKNWARLCHKCHKEWDNLIPRLIINRKKRTKPK